MNFEDVLKAELKKTNTERQSEKQTIINQGKQLSFIQLNDLLDKINYQIECLKSFIKKTDIPEIQKATSKTKLFYYEEKRKQIQEKIKDYFLEDYGI